LLKTSLLSQVTMNLPPSVVTRETLLSIGAHLSTRLLARLTASSE